MALLPKPVIISPKAQDDLDGIYEYISLNFGKTSLLKFNKKWNQFLLLISYRPTIFPYLSKSRNLRKYTIQPRDLIVYRNMRYHIEVVTIFNSRKNPIKLKEVK